MTLSKFGEEMLTITCAMILMLGLFGVFVLGMAHFKRTKTPSLVERTLGSDTVPPGHVYVMGEDGVPVWKPIDEQATVVCLRKFGNLLYDENTGECYALVGHIVE